VSVTSTPAGRPYEQSALAVSDVLRSPWTAPNNRELRRTARNLARSPPAGSYGLPTAPACIPWSAALCCRASCRSSWPDAA